MNTKFAVINVALTALLAGSLAAQSVIDQPELSFNFPTSKVFKHIEVNRSGTAIIACDSDEAFYIKLDDTQSPIVLDIDTVSGLDRYPNIRDVQFLGAGEDVILGTDPPVAWNPLTGSTTVFELPKDEYISHVRDMEVSPDGSKVAATFSTADIIVWDSSGSILTYIKDPHGSIYQSAAIGVNPEWTKLISASSNDDLKLFDISGATATEIYRRQDFFKDAELPRGLDWSPNGEFAVYLSGTTNEEQREILVFDPNQGTLIESVPFPMPEVSAPEALAISPNSEFALVVKSNFDMYLYDTGNWSVVNRYEDGDGGTFLTSASDAAWFPTNLSFIIGGAGPDASIWRVGNSTIEPPGNTEVLDGVLGGDARPPSVLDLNEDEVLDAADVVASLQDSELSTPTATSRPSAASTASPSPTNSPTLTPTPTTSPTTTPISSVEEVTVLLPGNVPLEMVRIPAMGSTPDERDRSTNEDPQTDVRISQGFYMGKHEVTQAQGEA